MTSDGAEVVAIEIDVEDADRNLALFQRLDLGREPLRQRHAAPADADERQLIQVFRLFENLVRQPDQGAVDLRGAHELRFDLRQSHRTDCSARNLILKSVSCGRVSVS